MTRKLILNVGLNIGGTTAISAAVAKEILIANGFVLGNEALVESDTEPALVIEAWPVHALTSVGNSLHQSAQDLQQDCIAAYNPATNKGVLIGPRAAAWGTFNPEFFFNLDGQRLSATVTQ